MSKNEAAVMEDKEKEFDLVSNPHPHPLIYYRQGKPDGQNIRCYKCSDEFCPPAFVCSDDSCNFNIHQSCIDLPYEIRSPFHNHVLKKSEGNNDPCNCCSQNQYGDSYICSEKCGFSMDVQCAMASPKASSLLKTTRGGELRHFSHPHPLILHMDTDQERRVAVSICRVCERPMTSTSSYYYCSRFLPQCLSNTFHKECAELPRQKLYPNFHPEHPLVLFAKDAFRSICVCCETECTAFFYSCHACKFNLHVYCLPLFNHKHHFHRFPYKITFECTICHISNKAFPWLCSDCYLLAHKECAIFKMSEDQFHSSSTQDHDSNLNQLGNRIKHLSHKHELTLCELHEDMLCHGCMRCIPAISKSYACRPCAFYLHKQCATLPTEHINSFLHPHVLSFVYIPDFVFSCAVCLQYCHGFAYRCEECYYVIDIQCAAMTFPFKHPSHGHPLTYYDRSEDHACKACAKKDYLMYKKVIGCEECKFYLHIRCARLPLTIINRFDEHPFILTFKDYHEYEREQKECEEAGYYCDVCEEQRNVNEWFYECRICRFAAHTKCVVGDYPFLKSAQFKNHVHPLTLVSECTKKKHSSRTCDACGDSLDAKLAFQCENSNCNFTMHAFGQCYHKHLTQGQITFSMPSLRYRSISLHPDQKWKLTLSSTMKAKLLLEKDKCTSALSFVLQGNLYGGDWDDGIYCSIRSLTIYVHGWDKWIGIKTEYEDKDGNSIWKGIHGYGLGNYNFESASLISNSQKITLNHPDEYITSLHGSYTNEYIRSLSFETNQRTFGPYGDDPHTVGFELIKFPALKGLKIVGLHGRSTHFALTAIGFHFIKI